MENNESTNENILNEKNYKKLEEVGKGAFGVVYKVEHIRSKNVFAWKEIRFNIVTLIPILNATMKEVSVLNVVNHEHLVKYYSAKMIANSFVILTEFMDKGSLRDFIEKERLLNEREAAKYTKAVLKGIKYLHDNKIVHRDIKCGNILWNSRNEIKLADFGLAKHVEEAKDLMNHTYCGTIYFMSPELISKRRYNVSVDIWATGVTVVEMLTGYPIYFKRPICEISRILNDFDRPITYEIKNASKQLDYFLQMTFRKYAEMRPTADDLLQTKFMQ